MTLGRGTARFKESGVFTVAFTLVLWGGDKVMFGLRG
jgi:hypothetical protein